MKLLWWWIGCLGAEFMVLETANRCIHHLFLLACYPDGYPALSSYIVVLLVSIPMWAAHEKWGWFGGYQSASDMPRVHVYPRHDRI